MNTTPTGNPNFSTQPHRPQPNIAVSRGWNISGSIGLKVGSMWVSA